MLKVCATCKVQKESSEFYKKTRFRNYPGTRAAYAHECKVCILDARRELYRQDPQKRKASDRKQHLRLYGLTTEGYNELFMSQEGRCGGCKTHQNEFNRHFCVDHDHETGKVRGLLCVGCNLILGYAQDQEQILFNLVEYLKSHSPGLADNNTSIVEYKFPKKVG